jgi:hypothetical protein
VTGEGFVQEVPQNSWKEYILRPETVESYVYLDRLTGDTKYRGWGWELVQALEKHSKSAFGYACMEKDARESGRSMYGVG